MGVAKIRPAVDQDGRTQGYLFDCPGCGHTHMVWDRAYDGSRPGWVFSGTLDNPTLYPSIVVRWGRPSGASEFVCHSFVENGRIRFLPDCTHELAGQTVDLPEISDDH